MTDETIQVVLVTAEEAPTVAMESALVASALAAGWDWADEEPYLDAIEVENGNASRRTAWALLDVRVTVDGEALRFQEFRERWESDEWRAAHPGSLISRLYRATVALHLWHASDFKREPHLVVRNGLLFARIPPGTPEDEARRLVAQIY